MDSIGAFEAAFDNDVPLPGHGPFEDVLDPALFHLFPQEHPHKRTVASV
ncbi:hypothetical protein [Arthrobacter sp. SW1]|nr:hypothetical protein [Arthrobacter sp. SW1]